MIRDEEPKRLNTVEQNTKIVVEILSVEEIVGGEKEVPG